MKSHQSNSENASQEPVLPHSEEIRLVVITGDNVPSKKNRHYADPTGHIRMDTKIKKRMALLENRILSVLLSSCLTEKNEMDLECLRRLRTRLSSLCDDSLKEISEHEWRVKYVDVGFEGVEIVIKEL